MMPVFSAHKSGRLEKKSEYAWEEKLNAGRGISLWALCHGKQKLQKIAD
jgi:hypothetical protein